MRTTGCLTTTLLVLARSLVLLGCSCWLIATANCSLFARESADVAATLPEPGGVRERPAAASQTIPLANPDFEQQWDGWTPRDQEGFSIETQPNAAHSGQACLQELIWV